MKATANFKKLALTAAAALVITTGSFTQSANNDLTALASLETIMTATEHAIRYVAPEVNDAEEFFAAAERLELLANNTEAGLKYAAPEAEEEIAPVIDRLNMMADATEASLQYNAPEVSENSDFQVENENEVMLAHYTK